MANQSLSVWLNNPAIKKKIIDRLGQNAAAFISTLSAIHQSNELLQKCDGRSILGAAFLAASLNLSIAPSLAHAYIVPYKGKDGNYYAQFQISAKGYIQLALRSGQYVRIYAGKVCEGEINGFNPATGEPVFGKRISDLVVGYIAYFKLINGFEKFFFMSKAEVENHAKKYSQSYRSSKASSPWTSNFDDMAIKTVLKALLRKWGILSADLNSAFVDDQDSDDREPSSFLDNVHNSDNISSHDSLPPIEEVSDLPANQEKNQ